MLSLKIATLQIYFLENVSFLLKLVKNIFKNVKSFLSNEYLKLIVQPGILEN